MSEIQEVDVFVKADGTVSVQVRGVKGAKCLDLTKKIEEMLGGQVVERIHTDEFSQGDQEQSRSDKLELGGR